MRSRTPPSAGEQRGPLLRVRLAIGSERFRLTSTSEAMALQRLGIFDNLTLLKMWCETTPETIFPRRKIGKFKDGYEASFLVLDADTLADFTNNGRIRMRVKQGFLPDSLSQDGSESRP